MGQFAKITEIRNYLNSKYFEREKEIDAILIALLSRQHVLLIGSPGTAKSALASELSKIVKDMGYFQWLLTRFSTPEELFGPLSIKDLEQGVYKRNTTGKLPEAHLAFLDEIFKANSAILNSLLTLINERIFYNNGGVVQSPLISIVGSSNEYPEEGEGLEALFDRFLLRFEIDYLQDDSNFISMLKGSNAQLQAPSMTLMELQQMQFFTDMVVIPDTVYQTLAEIRMELFNEGIRPSDRRFKQSLSVLKAKALLEQRQQVAINDIVFLENALWEDPSQKDITSQVVRSLAQDSVERELEQYKKEIAEIQKNLANLGTGEQDVAQKLEFAKKTKDILNSVTEMKQKHPEKAGAIDVLLVNVEKVQQSIIQETLMF